MIENLANTIKSKFIKEEIKMTKKGPILLLT